MKSYNIKNYIAWKRDIEIKIIGLRDGEKLYEELLIEAKSYKTEHKKIFKANENHFIKFLFVLLNRLSVEFLKLASFL